MSKTASIPSSQSTTTDTDVQRRMAKRKAPGVIDLIFGNTTARETARIHGLTRAGWCAGAWNSSLRLPRACAATRATSPNSKKSSAKSSWRRSANSELTLRVDVIRKVHRAERGASSVERREMPDRIFLQIDERQAGYLPAVGCSPRPVPRFATSTRTSGARPWTSPWPRRSKASSKSFPPIGKPSRNIAASKP